MASRFASPWLFFFLMIPFGVSSGYVSVTLASLLGDNGVSVEEVLALGAITAVPHMLKFLWSPVVDLTLSPKIWYVISALLTAVMVALFGAFPADHSGLGPLSKIVFLSGLATTVVGMSVEILMAHGVAEEKKGQTSGWFMAGNVGGSAFGGGLGLLIAVRVPQQWMASVSIAALCAACCLALAWVPSPPLAPRGERVAVRLKRTLLDAWHTVRERRGLLALILCVVPLGIGASSGSWSVIAPEWGASKDTVAIVTGILGGVVSTLGCISGGFLADRWNRQAAYVGFGIVVSLSGVAMALLPRTPEMFVCTTLLFSFAVGMSWAGYSAFVLEAIGKGAAATKFSAFASLANAPIYYMAVFNGWAHTAWKTSGMLYFEAAMSVLGAIVFIIAAKVLLPARRTPGADAGATRTD